MKILAPISNVEHVRDYIRAGADEFYIGFHDAAWEAAFGDYADLNRMSGFKERANPCTFEQVLRIVDEVRGQGKDIFVTLNAALYSEQQLQFLQRYLENLQAHGVSGLIVSGFEIARLAQAVGIPVIASTMCGIYNADLAQFYYDAGVQRMILPRDLALDEIAGMTQQVPGMQTEVFLMRNGCIFSDSNCLGLHRQQRGSLCGALRGAQREIWTLDGDFWTVHQAELNDMAYNRCFHIFACGLCALYRFVKMGITAGKIVGRADEHQHILRDIDLMRRNLDVAQEAGSEAEYLRKMVLPPNRVAMCKLGFSCYYPEVRFG